ncbi:MAG: hypothetical protein HY650_08060 [Acidobacteria bacterium]|nr:hypothetical protein [Acidobacteriota bacterium]
MKTTGGAAARGGMEGWTHGKALATVINLVALLVFLPRVSLAHNGFYQYENDPRVRDKRSDPGAKEDIDGHIAFEPGDTSHPKLLIECLGHGVFSYGHNGKEVSEENTYVIYRYGGMAGLPRDKNDHDVKYDLIDLIDPVEGLWTHRQRFEGETRPYAKPFARWWNGFFYSDHGPIGAAFYGHQGSQARPPWGWTARGVSKGDWFIIPAFSWSRHLVIPGLKPESTAYLHNPYLVAGGANPAGEVIAPEVAEAERPPEVTSEPTVLWNAQTGFSGWHRAAGGVLGQFVDRLPESLRPKPGPPAQDARNVIVRSDIDHPGAEVSRVFFSYANASRSAAGKLYWRTSAMEDCDDHHSLTFALSQREGWHTQTLELLESPHFEAQATILQRRETAEGSGSR